MTLLSGTVLLLMLNHTYLHELLRIMQCSRCQSELRTSKEISLLMLYQVLDVGRFMNWACVGEICADCLHVMKLEAASVLHLNIFHDSTVLPLATVFDIYCTLQEGFMNKYLAFEEEGNDGIHGQSSTRLFFHSLWVSQFPKQSAFYSKALDIFMDLMNSFAIDEYQVNANMDRFLCHLSAWGWKYGLNHDAVRIIDVLIVLCEYVSNLNER